MAMSPEEVYKQYYNETYPARRSNLLQDIKQRARDAGHGFERVFRDVNTNDLGVYSSRSGMDAPSEYWKIGGKIFPVPKKNGVSADPVADVTAQFDSDNNKLTKIEALKPKDGRLVAESEVRKTETARSQQRTGPAPGSSKEHKNPSKRGSSGGTRPNNPAPTPAPEPGSSKKHKNPSKRAPSSVPDPSTKAAGPGNAASAPTPGTSKKNKNPAKRSGGSKPINPLNHHKPVGRSGGRRHSYNGMGGNQGQPRFMGQRVTGVEPLVKPGRSKSRKHKNPSKRSAPQYDRPIGPKQAPYSGNYRERSERARERTRSRMSELSKAEQKAREDAKKRRRRSNNPVPDRNPSTMPPRSAEGRQQTRRGLNRLNNAEKRGNQNKRSRRLRQNIQQRNQAQQAQKAKQKAQRDMRTKLRRGRKSKLFAGAAVGLAVAGGLFYGGKKATDYAGKAITGDPNYENSLTDAATHGVASKMTQGLMPGYDSAGGMEMNNANMATMGGIAAAGAAAAIPTGIMVGKAAYKINKGRKAIGPGQKAPSLFSRRTLTAQGAKKKLASMGARGVGGAAAAGTVAGVAMAAGAATVASNFVKDVADKVLRHHGTSMSSSQTMPRARTKRGSASPHGVARYSGDYSGMGMTGDMVQALHKTGGSGGVIR